MEGRRPGRLAGQIQEIISEIIQRRIKDPRLGFVTLTLVKLTADLRHASVHVSVLGGEEEQVRSLACLESATSFIRSELGKRLRVRHIPDLKFFFDDSAVKGARIEEILKHLREGDHETGIQGDS
jgi:ribosome-binding factor A